ncbi:MAG TPA: phosphate signaling complex protein PhoU [Candidatus Contendobacter sp.]|nr:phosphate signaling complex protein PhoU [Candidatus Contendobacter sp.]HRZ23190.1 phosphate signaling complex protein PhoU [Candidatus Contendobacter sp.]HRZ52585.1 phosphate signaling complex protein PhoU [Candidatus Contendobacter sp.]
MAISQDAHTVKQFDVQLANLRNLVLEMGGLVEEQIKRAIQALDDEDITAAREVISRDQIINGLQVKADEDCVSIIALRQPLGSDLRLIMSLSKIVTDLERIGDEAEKIARMTVKIYEGIGSPPSAKLLRDVVPMAKLAQDMLHGCLDALARLDVEKAVEVAQGDDELDQEFQSALRRLITYMMEDPRTIGHAINVIFIVKALERIGDHSKNIAEYIIYLVKGKDVRHVSMDVLVQDALKEE